MQSLICLSHGGLHSRFLDTWGSLRYQRKPFSHVAILLYYWHECYTICFFTYHCYDINKKGSHGFLRQFSYKKRTITIVESKSFPFKKWKQNWYSWMYRMYLTRQKALMYQIFLPKPDYDWNITHLIYLHVYKHSAC